jgi:peptidyl-prolyl cis-trans isomerase C
MFRTSLSLLLLGLGLGACQPQVTTTPGEFPSTNTESVATVNGQKVPAEMLDAIMRSLPPQVKAQIEMMGDSSPLVESLVASELLYQKAIEAGVHNKPLVQQDMAMAVRTALAEAMVRDVVAERLTDQRIQQYYDEHQVQFAQPQLQLAHIMFMDMAKAEQVKTELDGGGDFAALAQANSKDTMTAAKGGEIGWLELKQLAPQMRGAIQSAAKGDVVGPIEMGGGSPMGSTIHIFKVLDRRDAKPLDEVKEQISAELEQTIRQEYLEELREAAVIVETYKQPKAEEPAAPDAAPVEPEAAPAEPGAAG